VERAHDLAHYFHVYTRGFATFNHGGEHGDARFRKDQRRPGQASERRHSGLLARGQAELDLNIKLSGIRWIYFHSLGSKEKGAGFEILRDLKSACSGLIR